MSEEETQDDPKSVVAQARGLWSKLPKRRRMVVVGGAVATLALAVFLIGKGQSAEYAVLFSGLSAEDAGEVVSHLQGQNEPYKLEAGGTIVKVKKSRVHELRIASASAGLPRGGSVGFELFDKQSFGTSSFVEQVNYRRALQGELSRSVSALAAVADARVHLALGKRSVFKDSDRPPSASVAVRLRGTQSLSRKQVQGIVNLVAGSVDGLEAKRVTVIDDKGKVLSGNEMDGIASGSGNELEQTLSRRVRDMLERVVGRDKVAVVVTAQMDYRRVDQTEEIYDQDKTALRSEARTLEGIVRGNKPPEPANTGGVAGVRGNLPGAPVAAPVNDQDANNLKQTRNYEVSKVVRRTSDPSLKVKKLHLAVIVDYGRGEDGKPVPRDAKELEHLAAVAKEAAGIDSARGDQVEIRSVPFADDGLAELPAEEPAKSAWPLPISPELTAAAAGGALTLIALLVFWLKRRKKRKLEKQELAEVVSLPAHVDEVQAALDGETGEELPQLEEAEVTVGQLHAAIAESLDSDPERTVRVLSLWIADDGEEAEEDKEAA